MISTSDTHEAGSWKPWPRAVSRNGVEWAEKGLIDWVIVDVNYVAPV